LASGRHAARAEAGGARLRSARRVVGAERPDAAAMLRGLIGNGSSLIELRGCDP
jgi:hypothetical protein